ncbi:MAG TPA: hypothetical protein VFN10_15340 [Thermoanaerobaculia bacterium]|nr:hypothetical protein [Thermoanaerobaculia bacterium]
MTRSRAAVLSFVLATFTMFLPAARAVAQDVVSVGTVSISGSVADVPVYIRDTPGTPLGIDKPAGSKIQSFSIKVTYAPASAVQSVSFSRAGITAGLTPTSEFAPATNGSASLLATFRETTNLIPFTPSASGDGDVVAHLLFTLAPSVTPGTTITLSLDPALTQLTDEGGDAATKESAGNGELTLHDGAIHVEALTLSISPFSRTINSGGSGSFTVTASGLVAAATTVSLTSGNTDVATVPASVVIPAGAKSAGFSVTGVSPGSATITATLPAADGGASAVASVNVAPPVNGCQVPAAPHVTAPSTAVAGTSYEVSWPAVANSTEFVVEEATDTAFSEPSVSTVTVNSATFTHDVAGIRYYYRVRAHNHGNGCDTMSVASTAVSVLVTATPPPPRRVLAVVGSTPGSFGSYFKTSVQLYNPKSITISGRIVFHPANQSGSANDPSLAYALPAGKTVNYDDLLPAMSVASGIGSADLLPDSGSPFPLATIRIYSDAGVNGTSGFAGEPLPVDDALSAGSTGALIAPANMQRFRLNVGIRTLDDPAAMTITVRDREGVVVKTVEKSYGANFFTQPGSAALLDGYALTGGETISFAITSGSAFIYGATTDNTTNDPSQLFAHPLD